jgi:hypothetical protein
VGIKRWCVKLFKKLSTPRVISSGCFIVEVSHFQLVIQIFQLHKCFQQEQFFAIEDLYLPTLLLTGVP